MTQKVVEDFPPPDLLVAVRFRPQDFEAAGVQHISLEEVCTRTTRTGTRDLVLYTRDRTAGSFIGSCLFQEIFQIADKERPWLKEGTEEWDIECWHWVLKNQDRELERGREYISQMPEEDYIFPCGKVKRARIFVLERKFATVKQLVDADGTEYTVQFG